jgi:hypothetical protein
MIHACSAWESAADIHALKLKRLENKVLRNIGNFPMRKPVRDLHTIFNCPCIYDYNYNKVVQATRRCLIK